MNQLAFCILLKTKRGVGLSEKVVEQETLKSEMT